MRSIGEIVEMKAASRAAGSKGQKIAFVPTMGALHEGHLSLVRRGRSLADLLVLSIFVNPGQFGPGEDFEKYPRNLLRDAARAAEAGVDILFTPSAPEIYPPAFCSHVSVEGISETYEGAMRPGHFRGVATVVLKLFHIVGPDVAVFGQKDAQQTAVIRRLIRDLDLGVEIVVAPTVRESDGLALSSRNSFLGPRERRAATVLSRALKRAEEDVAGGETDARALASRLSEEVAGESLAAIDYADVVSPEDFQPLAAVTPGALAILAARFGETRLIDNSVLNPPGHGPGHNR